MTVQNTDSYCSIAAFMNTLKNVGSMAQEVKCHTPFSEEKHETRCLHLGHAVWQVGRDGGETFPSTVHNVVTAGAHGRAGASADAARLQAGRLLVT